jgi:hypothetical protein
MTEKIRNDINDERHRQNETWGYNDHHIFKWLAIITEELGEASAEALEIDFLEREPRSEKDSNSYMNILIKEHREKLRKELIQVAASTVAALEHLDRKLDN